MLVKKGFKRLIVAILVAAFTFISVPSFPTLAAVSYYEKQTVNKEWMRKSRSLTVNKTTYYDLLNDDNNQGYSNARDYAFIFNVPRSVYMTYEIRLGGCSDELKSDVFNGIALYDLNGKRIWDYNFRELSSDCKYDSKTKETVIRIRETRLVASECYLRIYNSSYTDLYPNYVKITLTPRIPRTERINEIKKYGKQSVFLRWSKTTAATGYEVYRAETKAGTYTKIKTVTGGKIRCTINNVKKNKTYYYKVKAYRVMNGKKYYSNSASIKAFTLK